MQSFRKKKLAKGAEKNVFHIPLVESVEKPAGNLGKTTGGNRWKKLCQKNMKKIGKKGLTVSEKRSRMKFPPRGKPKRPGPPGWEQHLEK